MKRGQPDQRTRYRRDDGSDDLQFEIARDLVGTVSSDGYFTSLNAAWERVLGWSREELMSRPFLDFVHPEDLERTAAEAQKVDRPDYELVDFENRYSTKAGGWRWLRWSARSDGETWFAVAFDVTERKHAEAQLRALLTQGNLLAYSQPILETRGGRLAHEELLARVRSPGAGRVMILPAGFVPAAERHGLSASSTARCSPRQCGSPAAGDMPGSTSRRSRSATRSWRGRSSASSPTPARAPRESSLRSPRARRSSTSTPRATSPSA